MNIYWNCIGNIYPDVPKWYIIDDLVSIIQACRDSLLLSPSQLLVITYYPLCLIAGGYV